MTIGLISTRPHADAETAPRSATLTVYRWELEKLTAQWRVRICVLVCLLGPIAATLVLKSQQQTPSDTLFGRWVHTSGLAIPLLILAFVTQYAVPLLTGLVAGDIFAAEDHYGTWKMILTRTPGRRSIFCGKTLAAATYTLVIMGVLALSSTAAGIVIVGRQNLVSLSGTMIPPGHATVLAFLSWAIATVPALGYTAIGVLFSIATRHSLAGVIGPVAVGGLMQLYAFVGTSPVVRAALLSTPFDSWHGLFAGRPFYQPVVHGLITSAAYIVVCIGAGYVALRRRDFTQG